jgi:ribosomal protein S18 acetylase RimI-like enzyme
MNTHELITLAGLDPANNLHVTDLPYRLSSWALDNPLTVQLWRAANGQLLAWAVLQTPFWALDYAIHPDAGHLHPQILAWADGRARELLDTPYGHPAWFVNAFTRQRTRCAELEAAGFAAQTDVGEDSWSKVLLQRSSQAPIKAYPPPARFVVRPLAGESEVEAYVSLHRSVFESKNMTVEWRARTLQHPGYCPELDVVVAAPDGQLAAFCIGWLSGKRGQIEPLGCHKDYRRYALGRVALAETLRRLCALGAEGIIVETDSYRNTAFALYESLGFRVAEEVTVFRKDYA